MAEEETLTLSRASALAFVRAKVREYQGCKHSFELKYKGGLNQVKDTLSRRMEPVLNMDLDEWQAAEKCLEYWETECNRLEKMP